MSKRTYTVLLTIFLFLTTLNISLRYSVSYSLCIEEVGYAFAIRINDAIDTVYGDKDLDVLIDIQNSIGEENSIRKVTDKYINEVVYASLLNLPIEFKSEEKDIASITKETLELITEKLDDSWKEHPTFEEELSNEVENGIYTLQTYANGIATSLGNHKGIAIFYFILTSNVLCIFYVLSFVVCLLMTLKQLQKQDLIYVTKISTLVSGMAILLIGYVFHIVSWKLSNRILGRTIDFVVYPFIIFSISMFLGTIVISMYHKIISRVEKCKK